MCVWSLIMLGSFPLLDSLHRSYVRLLSPTNPKPPHNPVNPGMPDQRGVPSPPTGRAYKKMSELGVINVVNSDASGRFLVTMFLKNCIKLLLKKV